MIPSRFSALKKKTFGPKISGGRGEPEPLREGYAPLRDQGVFGIFTIYEFRYFKTIPWKKWGRKIGNLAFVA